MISLSQKARHRARTLITLLMAFLLVAPLAMATAAPVYAAVNKDIIVDSVTIGGGTGPEGQLIIGDKIEISGSWDATDANPKSGDEFQIGLPPEFEIPTDLPFTLDGLDVNGETVAWANCLAESATGTLTCTLTEEVAANPELVQGEFLFEAEVIAATTENEVVFDLNGSEVGVELPGGGGIDDGVEIPDEWSKSGEMNSNNWSMAWKVDLPGSRMQGHDVINIADNLSDNHALCEPANVTVQTVRGNDVNDVTEISDLIRDEADPHSFTIQLNAPASGFRADVTYRITYETCTPDNQIHPEDHEYTNEATVDIWGETSGVIGVKPHPWHGELTKYGSVLGGGDRNGRIAWEVTVPGNQLIDKTGFTMSERLGDGHAVCTDTIKDIRVTERYGPSGERQEDITEKLTIAGEASSSQEFEVRFDISDDSFRFQPSDHRYIITYQTCVTQDDLPEGGTKFSNEVTVDGKIVSNAAEVPGRAEGKGGAINSRPVTIDGVERLPQTTMNWNITVPGERLQEVDSDLTVTDVLKGDHEVCVAGDPTGGLKSQLGLRVEARDQIQGGGLETVDLTDSVVATQDGDNLAFTIPQPDLPQPDGENATGFSTEYQYLISYTTCTTSGGMDAPGTTYGNAVTVAGNSYETSVTQSNRGSGTGTGVPRGSVSVSKALADTPGAEFVSDDTTFTVHVQEVDPKGEVQVEYDLEVPLDGSVSGPNSRGNGWTAVLTEPTFPSIPGVTFGDPVFAEGDGVAVSNGGKTATASLIPGRNIEVEVTNEALLGSISIEKELSGDAADQVDPDAIFEVTASIDTSDLGENFPEQADRTFDLVANKPVTLENLPIGSTVTFSETALDDDDKFTWGEPVFDPESVTVTEEHASTPATVTLTNSVERTVGTFSLQKNVTGEQADNPAVPDAVTVTATWDEEGTAGSKELEIPTDGTSVPLGEDLLIGTQVTLTETPLIDGSSIVWSAPIWSGDGVTIEGDSAVVTIGRDGDAMVNLENHAATSVAGITLIKGIAGEAAGEVEPDTEFPVTATWEIDGEEYSKDLLINAVEPTSLGEELPAGTVVTIVEQERPGIDTVVWGTITISGDDVTDAGDGTAEIIVSDQQDDVTLVTVVNEATWAPGTFSIGKDVTGVLLDNPDVPEDVTVTASWVEDGEVVSEAISVPTDGTVVPFGRDLPHGTEVSLTEESIDSSSSFTWDDPAWEAEGIEVNDDGTATIIIGAATDIQVALTNSATALLGNLSLTKSLSGDGATDVPSGTVFPVTAAWTDLVGEQHEVDLELTAGEATVLADLPLGTEVTLTEGETESLEGVKWLGATWSTDADGVTIDGEGTEITITIVAEAGAEIEVDLDNEFEKTPDLPVTGSQLLKGGIILAVILIAGGALIILRRRMA